MKKPAILLIGPTGSGKSPLGSYLEENGISQHRLAHFDFGELLRQTAAGKKNCGMPEEDIAQLKQILKSGALLERENFYLAERIINHFNSTTSADVIILNGLPRHVNQAKEVSPWFDVRAVIQLECDAQTVVSRIQSNAGNDRTHRSDDDLKLVQRKLEIFETRTAPLCTWFKAKGVRIIKVSVSSDTQPETFVPQLESALASLSF